MDEGVTYADLRLPPTPVPQQTVRLPWCWAALSLAVFSLLLLLAQIILISLSFHYLGQQASCIRGPWSGEESPSYGRQTQRGQCQFCPAGWLWDAGQCYYFSFTKKSWEQSREDCCSRGAQLVTVRTNTTLAFLMRTANTEVFHVGLKRDGSRSDWKWLDGTALKGGCPSGSIVVIGGECPHGGVLEPSSWQWLTGDVPPGDVSLGGCLFPFVKSWGEYLCSCHILHVPGGPVSPVLQPAL
ncbi:killer cell lectin-like receptor subfamily G member 1 isoform X2 [Lathamus discolor]|uniref:killer cell lectin-like receptor subfamily G member 1 isoform X2 n=1 Tax=Lathamus discolor TaxID=678569 RepID=UPI0032B769F5